MSKSKNIVFFIVRCTQVYKTTIIRIQLELLTVDFKGSRMLIMKAVLHLSAKEPTTYLHKIDFLKRL